MSKRTKLHQCKTFPYRDEVYSILNADRSWVGYRCGMCGFEVVHSYAPTAHLGMRSHVFAKHRRRP